MQPSLPGALAFDTMAPRRLPEPQHLDRDPQYFPAFDVVEPRVRTKDLAAGVQRFPSPTHGDLLEGNRLVGHLPAPHEPPRWGRYTMEKLRIVILGFGY